MKNKYKILFFYTLSSLLLTYVILGKNNISPTFDNWMLQGDAASNLVAWKYFFNDIWRFPIGLNPNYGLSQGSSIIYSGPAPLPSIFFKLIKNFLPNNFHFFSIWIFLCFLFQSLFSRVNNGDPICTLSLELKNLYLSTCRVTEDSDGLLQWHLRQTQDNAMKEMLDFYHYPMSPTTGKMLNIAILI